MAFHQIIEKQRSFFNTGETKKIDYRRGVLNTLRKLLTENGERFCDAVYRDHRRLREITDTIEIQGSLTELDFFLDNFEEWSAPLLVEHTDVLNEKDVPMIVKDPKGVVLVIGAWNYPIMLLMAPLIPALAAGNTVVMKPSEVSSNTAHAFEEIFPKYFDEKQIAVIQGGIPETTDLLKERFDHILYTGAPFVGKIVMEAAAKHLTPVTLELGGKCPVIVADDADIELAAKTLAAKKWSNCGQTCTSPDYLLASSKTKRKLVEELKKAIDSNFSSDIKSDPKYSRLINERHFDRVKTLLDKSKADVLVKAGELDRKDVFIPPVVLDAKADDAVMEDEIFGPVLPIITSESLDKSIEHINKGEKPLAAYIFTKDQKNVERLYKETSSGAVVANDVMSHFAVNTLPFGGVGNSGMGRYRGKFGFDTFTHEKAVLLRNLSK
ncbi:hypothetical protein QR680_007130 [Steinernema hermaphroditum]|uniref:Aldehyde dehydrogenase n=1 Tax=Steinernema hermaphroditum TaxID=289476 RepID=A0AA39LYL2_9BILA|nr:hypothetical protein QR680_007130 [Steinernema hermaphroditum]